MLVLSPSYNKNLFLVSRSLKENTLSMKWLAFGLTNVVSKFFKFLEPKPRLYNIGFS